MFENKKLNLIKGVESNLYTIRYWLFSGSIKICFRILYQKFTQLKVYQFLTVYWLIRSFNSRFQERKKEPALQTSRPFAGPAGFRLNLGGFCDNVVVRNPHFNHASILFTHNFLSLQQDYVSLDRLTCYRGPWKQVSASMLLYDWSKLWLRKRAGSAWLIRGCGVA